MASLFSSVHHVALIVSHYEESKVFYVQKLGLKMLRETFREDRQSWKLDLALGDQYLIELFSFPDSPPRLSYPEASGLRHLAFSCADLDATMASLLDRGIGCEPIRIDETTGSRFTFFHDPDGLPLELYETVSHV